MFELVTVANTNLKNKPVPRKGIAHIDTKFGGKLRSLGFVDAEPKNIKVAAGFIRGVYSSKTIKHLECMLKLFRQMYGNPIHPVTS